MPITAEASATLLERFQAVRRCTEELCAPLSVEDHLMQPIEAVSPPKWHLGHTTWFFETFLLRPNIRKFQLFDPQFPYIFNSYYQSAGERLPKTERHTLNRPLLEKVHEYRQYVDRAIEDFVEANEGLTMEQEKVLEIGIQHEQQHQELLFYDIKYILGSDHFQPPYFESPSPASGGNGTETPSGDWIELPEGIYTIGHDGSGFAYDNEYGRHNVYLHRARVQDRLITNGEWIEFMESGGYDNADLWLDEGWTWKEEGHVRAPLYWFMHGGRFYTYTLHGVEEVDPAEPVTHISYYEAQAFAHWKGKRLPTEAEWEVLCNRLHDETPEEANLQEGMQGRPLAKRGEHFQFFGDCWEWTQSAYLPYPFYKREPGAMGEYNGKFMCGQMVLRGGSCATPRSHIRASYRNFFHPPERWLFSGLRLAETLGE